MIAMNFNRRGFISSLAGLVGFVTGSKAKASLSPAASAIQPTCSMDEAAQRVSLSAQDSAWVNNSNAFQVGQLVDVYSYDFMFRGTSMIASIYDAKDILHLSGDSRPQAGDYLVVHGGVAPRPNPITYYRSSENAGSYMGLARS